MSGANRPSLETGVVDTHLSIITRFDQLHAVALAARLKLSGLEGRSPEGSSALFVFKIPALFAEFIDCRVVLHLSEALVGRMP